MGEPALDALLPPEMAQQAENVGVRKAALPAVTLVALAVLGGAFIALGGVFAITAAAGSLAAPWGVVRVITGMAFSLGLILVLVGGAELFTGNNLIVMAWASGRVTTRALVRNWALVFAGNGAGAVATALLVSVAGVHRFGAGAWGVTALSVAMAKLDFGFVQAVALGILGNALVCLAVWLTYSARTTTDRILAIVPPISAFVAAGFEHSIANAFVVPLALMIARLDPSFAATHGVTAAADGLSWSRFVVHNLVPVTLGNVIGGAALVGVVYWFVYLRGREEQCAAGRPGSWPTVVPGGNLRPPGRRCPGWGEVVPPHA
jgi:formate/nitrite transporter